MDSDTSQCPTAITFIAFFAGLFATSLIINFAMVAALVTIVCKMRKKRHTGEYYTDRAKNLYLTKASNNIMWSDEAPEYSHDHERSFDLEDSAQSTTSQDKPLKDSESGKNSIGNPHYEHVQLAKKTVRFTSV